MRPLRIQSFNRWAPRVAALSLATVLGPAVAHAVAVPQDSVRRVLSMLEAAAEDYREGVRDGTVVRAVELEEVAAFLEELRAVRGSVDGLRLEIEMLRDAGATAPLGRLGDRLATAVLRGERLAEQRQQSPRRDAAAGARRPGH